MSVLALELGGSHISCALVAGTRVCAEADIPADARGFAEVRVAVEAMLCRCLEAAGGPVEGLAVGFCGIVDGQSGEVLATLDKYPDFAGFDLAGWARDRFGLPVRIENDTALALLGEARAGAAQGARDVVLVTLGTGIGAAAMLGGRLLRSRHGQAGCLGGHLTVNYRGRRCVCGAIGCAEAEASTSVLPLLCREVPGFGGSALAGEARLDFETLFRVAEAGDTVACAVAAQCMEVWSALTVALIHAYGPLLVLFGGRGDAGEAGPAGADPCVCGPAQLADQPGRGPDRGRRAGGESRAARRGSAVCSKAGDLTEEWSAMARSKGKHADV